MRIVLAALLAIVLATPAQAAGVRWLPGYKAPGTPARYDKVGVLEVGPKSARNVLVLVPGTSAGAAYFAPLARTLTHELKGWQVWSVERREKRLEGPALLRPVKGGAGPPPPVFHYYPGRGAHPPLPPPPPPAGGAGAGL